MQRSTRGQTPLLIGRGAAFGLLWLSTTLTSCQRSEAPAEKPSPHESRVPGAEPTYLVIYRAGPRWLADKPMSAQPLREHGAYMLSLYRSGKLHHAGPLGERGGAVLFSAANDAAALAIVQADPAVRTQLFDFELQPWHLVDWRSKVPGASK